MPISGIDAQLTINHALEVSREASTQAQKINNAQAFSVSQAKAAGELEKQTVSKIDEVKKTELSVNKDGGDGGAPKKGGGNKRELPPEELIKDETFAGYSENEIDIEI